MSGKFVTIEGCEGVGKSTLTAGLKRYFEQNGIDAVFTREPGGTRAAHRSRRLEIGTFIAITQKGGQRPPFLSEQNVTWPFQPLRSPR